MNDKGGKKQYKEKYITIGEREILLIDQQTFQIGRKPEATPPTKLLDTVSAVTLFPFKTKSKLIKMFLTLGRIPILLEPGKSLLLSVGADVPELSKDATVWPNT